MEPVAGRDRSPPPQPQGRVLERGGKPAVRGRIRARDVSIALARPTGLSIRNVLAGTVVELGDQEGSSLDVRLDLRGTALLARITRKSAAELGLKPGLPVFALIKAGSIDRRSVGYA